MADQQPTYTPVTGPTPDISPTVSSGREKGPIRTAGKGPSDLQDLAAVSSGPNVGFNQEPGNVLEAGNWPDIGPVFPLISPQTGPAQFPQASVPAKPPFDEIPVPQHVSTGQWQMSFYDSTATEPAGVFQKLQSGPLDLNTGRFTGEGFHAGHRRFRQT